MSVATPRKPLREQNKDIARERVLDAAERLLQRAGAAGFSMRALAAEAGVGFATPFNHFGNKNAIMQALSTRLIASMAERFSRDAPKKNAIERVLAMGRIAVGVLLESPEVNKTVVGSLSTVDSAPTAVSRRSADLWALALGDYEGFSQSKARSVLPDQLAFFFRGCVSFWIAGEVADDRLASAFETGATVMMIGLASPALRARLSAKIAR